MGSITDYFTRERANDGITVDLIKPDGSKSGDWLKIRGIDSDTFRETEAEAKRDVLKLASIEDPIERKKAIKTATLELVACLVIEWSFNEPCDYDHVMQFLTEAPQVADQINQASARRALFFGKSLNDSKTTRAKKSSST